MTTDPRTVTTGKVTISASSKAKRDALIGRQVCLGNLDGWPFGRCGTVESIEGTCAIVRFTDGTWARSGRTLDLV